MIVPATVTPGYIPGIIHIIFHLTRHCIIMPPESDCPECTTVYRGLPGDGFEDLIRNFSDAVAADPFGTWLILPTNRLVRQVLDKLVDGHVRRYVHEHPLAS